MNDKIKIGVVGAGIYGKHHIDTYLRLNEVEEVIVCDTNSVQLESFTKEYGLKGYSSVNKMVNNVKLDAVSICTPDPYHFEPLKDAINGGIKNILCEKPLTTSSEQANEIRELAEKNNVNIFIDFHKRWDPAYNAIRDKIKINNDKIIRGYMSLDDIIDVPLNWFNWTEKSSPAWFVGTHCVDLMRYITESEVTKVYATANKGVLKKHGIDVYDNISALLTFSDGSNWALENNWILPNSYPKSNDGQLVIVTDKQYFKNESYRGLKTYDESGASLPNYIFMNYEENKASGFGLEPMIDFVHNIVYGSEVRADLYDGIETTKIIEAIHYSVETGEVIFF